MTRPREKDKQVAWLWVCPDGHYNVRLERLQTCPRGVGKAREVFWSSDRYDWVKKKCGKRVENHRLVYADEE